MTVALVKLGLSLWIHKDHIVYCLAFKNTSDNFFFSLSVSGCRCFSCAIYVLHGDSRHASLLHGAGTWPIQQGGRSGGLEDMSHI